MYKYCRKIIDADLHVKQIYNKNHLELNKTLYKSKDVVRSYEKYVVFFMSLQQKKRAKKDTTSKHFLRSVCVVALYWAGTGGAKRLMKLIDL